MVKKTRLTERLHAFAEAHPEGWNHDEWLGLLDDLNRSGAETSEADLVGKQLEEMRLAGKLRQSGVSGLGPKRIEALVNRFGTVWSLKHASVDAVAEIPTIPRGLAEKVVKAVD